MASHFICPFIQRTLTARNSCFYSARTIPASGNYNYYANKDIYYGERGMHTQSTLDSIKIDKGADGLKYFFYELCKKDYKEAICLVNEENLHFGSLYILQHEIEVFNLNAYLSMRNKIAIAIIDEVLSGSKSMSSMECSVSEYIQTACSALKWILISGTSDDGLEDNYDKVLDVSAALLVKVYGERAVLTVILDLVFERNRRKCFYYDLVWTFFESRYPYCLILIAEYLLSKQTEDVRLAQRLLSFIPGIDANREAVGERQYSTALNWLEWNYPYLYFTGESFQQSISPEPYRVIPGAKYLCKAVEIETGSFIEPLAEYEHKLLKEFGELGEAVKKKLSNFSNILHDKNICHWNMWIHRPISEQVEIADFWMGGAV